MPKVYIAGPMRGKPNFNFDAFDEACAELTSDGYKAISPADLDRVISLNPDEQYPKEGKEFTYQELRDTLRRDINLIFDLNPYEGDGILLLKGWKDSAGAMAEFAVANYLGLKIFMQQEGVNEKTK